MIVSSFAVLVVIEACVITAVGPVQHRRTDHETKSSSSESDNFGSVLVFVIPAALIVLL